MWFPIGLERINSMGFLTAFFSYWSLPSNRPTAIPLPSKNDYLLKKADLLTCHFFPYLCFLFFWCSLFYSTFNSTIFLWIDWQIACFLETRILSILLHFLLIFFFSLNYLSSTAVPNCTINEFKKNTALLFFLS